jgi:deoxycytidylate deaminase
MMSCVKHAAMVALLSARRKNATNEATRYPTLI